jgi:ActR/RegA family two-component response regulator
MNCRPKQVVGSPGVIDLHSRLPGGEALETVIGVPAVLVVDDDGQFLRALRRRKYERVRLFTAHDDVSALAIVARETVDVVIVDLRLGKDWGIDLIGALRAARPGLHVTITSASLRPDDVILAMRSGADDVVPKPFEIPKVLARIVIGPDSNREPPVAETLRATEAAHISRVFAEAGCNISLAARRLGITRQRLVRKLEQLRTIA